MKTDGKIFTYGTRFLDMTARSFSGVGKFLDYYFSSGGYYQKERDERTRLVEKNYALGERVAGLESRVAEHAIDKDSAIRRMKKAEKARVEAEKRAENVMNRYGAHRVIELEGLVGHLKEMNRGLRGKVFDRVVSYVKRELRKSSVILVDYEDRILFASRPAKKVLGVSCEYDLDGMYYHDAIKKNEKFPEIKSKGRHFFALGPPVGRLGKRSKIPLYTREHLHRANPKDIHSEFLFKLVYIQRSNKMMSYAREFVSRVMRVFSKSETADEKKPAIEGGEVS